MYHFEIGKMKFRYLVGSYNVGIITPSRKRVMVLLQDIQRPALRPADHPKNGSADDRLSSEEVAAYCIENKLK